MRGEVGAGRLGRREVDGGRKEVTMFSITRARVWRVFCASAVPVFVLAGLAVASAPAQAKAKRPTSPPPAVTPGSRYLALGDSVTFGYEEAQVVPAPDYADAASFPGYPEQLGSELHLTVANAACPGETSASLIDASAASNGCENTPGMGNVGYRTVYPLHVKYKGSQLAFAVSYLRRHHDVSLVSLMIGANDFFLCEETTADACASLSEQGAVLASVAKNVHEILSTIRKKAHYAGQLAIVNYYSLDFASATEDAQVATLNKTVDSAAAPFHVVIANGYAAFQAAAAHSGGNTCNAGLLTQLGTPGTCGIHPSYAGQALLAQALEKVIRLLR
jgi:lysophospholipase L1-like esterase